LRPFVDCAKRIRASESVSARPTGEYAWPVSSASEPDFDLSAAGLRADGEDLRVSLEVLAGKLEQSLPERTHVERSGGGLLGRGAKHVRLVRVELGGMRYRLAIDGERVESFREREVGGISIKREPLDPQAWLEALTEDLRAEAERSAQAREALARLLD
jgi:hypothetical protein